MYDSTKTLDRDIVSVMSLVSGCFKNKTEKYFILIQKNACLEKKIVLLQALYIPQNSRQNLAVNFLHAYFKITSRDRDK